MIARRLEALSIEVRELGARRWWSAGLALAALAGAPVAAHWNRGLAAGLLIGGLVEGVLALSASSRRHDLLARLAARPDTYELPEVRRFGAALTSRSSREWMAASLRVIVTVPPPHDHLEHQIAEHRDDLLELADDLVDSETVISPVSAVALFSLLNDGRESPLFNPFAPTGELHSALLRIHDGIRHGRGRRARDP